MTTFIDREVPRKQKTSTKIYNALSGLVDKGNAYYKGQKELGEDTKALKALGVPDDAIALARRNPKVMEQLIGGSVSRSNEAAKQQTTNQNNEEVLRGIEEERQLPEGSLNKFRSNPALANQVTKPKNPIGGLSGQPIPSQDVQKIETVLANHPDASPDKLNVELSKAGINPTYAEPYVENRREEFKSRAETGSHITKKTAESDIKSAENLQKEADVVRKNLPLQRQAIADIKSSAPNVTGRDYIAEKFHFEPLRSSAGAKLKTAIKDFFLSDIGRVGRPNQWVEQQLAEALPTFGRDPESNISTALGLEFKVDVADKLTQLESKLAQQDRENFGYVKGSTLRERASESMEPWLKTRNEKLALDIQKNKERFDQRAIQNLDPVPKGTPLTEERAIYLSQEFGEDAEEIAKELGYQIMSDELYEAE